MFFSLPVPDRSRRVITHLWHSVTFVLIAGGILIASGCATTVYVVGTQVPSTYTPTPLSTPLPTVSTQVPLGANGNPYHMAIVTDKADLNVAALASYLTAQTGADFTVDKVATTAQALQQACTSPTFVWLDTTGVLAATGQNCGTLALKIEQANGSTPKAGLIVDVIGRSVTGASINTLADLKGKVFCRLNDSDLTSWVVPALLLRGAKLDLALDLAAVRDFPDQHSLMQALANGPCSAIGIASGTLDLTGLTIPNGVRLNVLKTSPAAPFGGLIISNGVPSAIADKVAAALATNPASLRAVINVDQLAPASSTDFADFAQLVQSAGIDFSVLGH